MRQFQDWLREKARRSPRLYALLRPVKRRLDRIRDRREGAEATSLPADGFRARIAIKGSLPPFKVGTSPRLAVEVTNLSSHTWPGGGLALSYHWRRDDTVWAFDGGRTDLPGQLEAGETVGLGCTVRSPNTPGGYVLELDLVHGRDAWFSQHGSETARREIVVGGMQPDGLAEIDYEQIYAAADLTKDYWGVVGPASPEEFRQIGQVKRRMLEEIGLRSDSKVLDVGCGTGSLTESLADFLGSEGLYYGTDLSEIAVQFCRETYVRPNFRFAKNGMTTLPIEGLRFDFIVFYSVFTHTYPAETRELLAEAARVLDDGGMIVADVFESDIDGDSLGTRAMIVLDRRRMLGLAEDLGLEARTMSEFSWDPTGPRRIDRVMRRFAKRGATLNPARSETGALP